MYRLVGSNEWVCWARHCACWHCAQSCLQPVPRCPSPPPLQALQNWHKETYSHCWEQRRWHPCGTGRGVEHCALAGRQRGPWLLPLLLLPGRTRRSAAGTDVEGEGYLRALRDSYCGWRRQLSLRSLHLHTSWTLGQRPRMLPPVLLGRIRGRPGACRDHHGSPPLQVRCSCRCSLQRHYCETAVLLGRGRHTGYRAESDVPTTRSVDAVVQVRY